MEFRNEREIKENEKRVTEKNTQVIKSKENYTMYDEQNKKVKDLVHSTKEEVVNSLVNK